MEARRRRVVGGTTVDGSEIRETHQLSLVVYPIIYLGFIHPRWCRISAINRRMSRDGSYSLEVFDIEKWWLEDDPFLLGNR